MNVINIEKEAIHFTTFDSERNQGRVYSLGSKVVDVFTIEDYRTKLNGCTSWELYKERMDVVKLEGRLFLVEDPSRMGREPDKRSVSIPFGFKPNLLFPPKQCPYCGK